MKRIRVDTGTFHRGWNCEKYQRVPCVLLFFLGLELSPAQRSEFAVVKHSILAEACLSGKRATPHVNNHDRQVRSIELPGPAISRVLAQPERTGRACLAATMIALDGFARVVVTTPQPLYNQGGTNP